MKKNNTSIINNNSTEKSFYADMTRERVCRLYADLCGEKYGFTDKDYAWTDEYKYATAQTDEFLLRWCKINLG